MRLYKIRVRKSRVCPYCMKLIMKGELAYCDSGHKVYLHKECWELIEMFYETFGIVPSFEIEKYHKGTNWEQ